MTIAAPLRPPAAAPQVFLITFVLIASPVASALVGVMVVLCDVGLLGFMWYAEVQFNSVSAINLLLSVGLSVDYTAHIAHHFMLTPGDSRVERARSALKARHCKPRRAPLPLLSRLRRRCRRSTYHVLRPHPPLHLNFRLPRCAQSIGGEVLHGSFTTLLAVLIMGAASSYIFKARVRTRAGGASRHAQCAPEAPPQRTRLTARAPAIPCAPVPAVLRQVFFKLFFALIVLAAWHGLVILPVVLSYIGPPAYDD